jgi:hypothetical protein
MLMMFTQISMQLVPQWQHVWCIDKLNPLKIRFQETLSI